MPRTNAGRFVAACAMFMGVFLLAMPLAIVGNAFVMAHEADIPHVRKFEAHRKVRLIEKRKRQLAGETGRQLPGAAGKLQKKAQAKIHKIAQLSHLANGGLSTFESEYGVDGEDEDMILINIVDHHLDILSHCGAMEDKMKELEKLYKTSEHDITTSGDVHITLEMMKSIKAHINSWRATVQDKQLVARVAHKLHAENTADQIKDEGLVVPSSTIET